jgi:predicted nucleic acid-binding protein
MDFADATLLVLAEELNTELIFTVDRDFDIYRIRGRKRFRIFPESR